MATETVYLQYDEAVLIHFALTRKLGENRYGIDHRSLIESALARSRHAAIYEDADLIRQAATLLFGLIKNHSWLGGNKRTATTLLRRFGTKRLSKKLGDCRTNRTCFVRRIRQMES